MFDRSNVGFLEMGLNDRISISQGSCIFYISTIFIIAYDTGAIADESKRHKYICQPVNLWAKIPMLPSGYGQPHMYHILCLPPQTLCASQKLRFLRNTALTFNTSTNTQLHCYLSFEFLKLLTHFFCNGAAFT